MKRTRGRPPGPSGGPHPLPRPPPPSAWPAAPAPALPGAAQVVTELPVVPPNPEATAYDHEKQAALFAYHEGERRARRLARCQDRIFASFGVVLATLAAMILVHLVSWVLATQSWPAWPVWPVWPAWPAWPVGGSPEAEGDVALVLRERLGFDG